MIVWAVSSWLSSMIVIFPAESGSFSATRPITATWSPSWMMIGRRSSTTLPPSVWMNFVLSSSRRTSWRCVLVVVSTQTSARAAARAPPPPPDPRQSARDRPEREPTPSAPEAVDPRSPPRRRRLRTACRPRCSQPACGSRRSRSCSARPSRTPTRRAPCARRSTRASRRARAGPPQRSARARRSGASATNPRASSRPPNQSSHPSRVSGQISCERTCDFGGGQARVRRSCTR